ncbi:hypothetical protein [Muricoccus aerilatus]|uniref:hypothetical protein n=1 Tax=Muricoccus aerilatus TaxID=452982 RepID=UPI0012EB980F|nr:hypothetical protein [Roseomonas aerilata]
MNKLTSRRQKVSGAENMNLLAGDDRSQRAGAIIKADDVGREVVTELFAGLPLDPEKLRLLLQARTVITEEWGKAQNSALRVGQTLLHLSRTLTEDEFRRVRKGCDRLFSISDAMATKLRLAALTVEDWQLSADQAPPYTVLYEISTLPPEGQQLVRERGLMRPDVRRGEIVAVRRELKAHKIMTPVQIEGYAEPSPPATTTLSRDDLLSERARLLTEVARIDGLIARMDADRTST